MQWTSQAAGRQQRQRQVEHSERGEEETEEEAEARVAKALHGFEAQALELEAIGEQIILDRRQMVDYDRRRQKNREALNSMKKRTKRERQQATLPVSPSAPLIEEVIPEEEEKQQPVWMFTGSLFVKLPKEKAEAALAKEQDGIDEELARLQADIKRRVVQLEKLENREEEEGLMTAMATLKAM